MVVRARSSLLLPAPGQNQLRKNLSGRPMACGHDRYRFVCPPLDRRTLDGCDKRPPSYPELRWASDSESILFTGSRQGDWTLWRVSRDGGVPQRVPGPGQGVWYVSAAKDLVLFQQDHHDSNLVDIDLGSMREKRMFVSTRQEATPRVSPDGARVAFISDRDGNRDCGWPTSMEAGCGG